MTAHGHELSHGCGFGKLLLFGEHAAVHGYPAVGLALPQQTRVTIGSAADPASAGGAAVGTGTTPLGSEAAASTPAASSFAALGWQIHGLYPRHHTVFTQLLQKLHTLLPETPRLARNLQDMSITSGVPFESGFGSSGSLSAALLRAVSQALSLPPDPERLWQQANTLEAVFHGTPSGIDTGLAVFGGCLAFRFPGSGSADSSSPTLPRRQQLPEPGVPLLIGAIPRRASTRELVALVHSRLEADPPGVQVLLQKLGQHAEGVIQHIGSNTITPAILGAQAAHAQSELTELGVSSRELEETFAKLYDLGAIGCKLSGAGGGGAFYAVFPDHTHCRTAADSMRRALAQQYPQGGWHVFTTE